MPVSRIAKLWLQTQRSALLRLNAIGRRIGRTPQLPPHLATGVRGETEALFHLRRIGYTVVARRWRSPELRGDIDLVGWNEGVLCFIEVKTRTARDLSPAQSAVDSEKKQILRQMARAYLRRIPGEQRHATVVRFDVLAVYLTAAQPEFELFRSAFGWV